MKIKTLIANMTLGCGILLLASCSSSADEETFIPNEDVNFAIAPNVGLGNITATRAGGVIYPSDDPITNLAVSAFRVNATNADGDYPADFSTTVGPKPATLKGKTTTANTNATIKFDTGHEQYYLSNGWKSKVLSVYPRIADADWTASGGTVNYDISQGNSDVMATQWGEGYKKLDENPAVSVQPQGMNYNHLLTQVKVQIYAIDAVAQAYWGDIKSVSIGGLPNKATVTIPVFTSTDYPTLAAASDATTTDPIAVTKIDGTTATILAQASVPVYDDQADPKVTPSVFGYCMFVPATYALPLTIVTQKGTDSEVSTSIVVPSQAYNRATAYTITLKLAAYEIIPVGVTIEDWTPATIGEIQI